MAKSNRILIAVLIVATVGGAIIGCGLWRNNRPALKMEPVSTNSNAQEQPVAPKKNPPGDIPDSQVFVKYQSSTEGYELQVPEGWGRTEISGKVSFVDKLDGVQVAIEKTPRTFTIIDIRNQELAKLKKTGRAVRIVDYKEIKPNRKTAFFISYECPTPFRTR
jgi:hypothetical protein